MILSDQDVMFFGTLNCLPITKQKNRNTNAERYQLTFPRVPVPGRQQFVMQENVSDGGGTKAQAKLLRQFIDRLKLSNNHQNEYGLIFDLEFFAFLRKPERIHVDKLKHHYRVVMSLDDKFYTGEDKDLPKAINAAAKLIYEPFLNFKHRAIPMFKAAGQTDLQGLEKMEIAVAKDKNTLKKFRPYIENEPLVLIDLEGDQLGPNGRITFMQINTFYTERCFLVDILEIGDDELKNKDGWLRALFENKTQTVVMWGGLQDAANLWYQFHIKVECMLDLQVVEQFYRDKLKDSAYWPYYAKLQTEKQLISLETAYKAFDATASLLEYKTNQAQHKNDYHVWAQRPLDEKLFTYAAFDVASLRPVLRLFIEKLELFKWGVFESAITKSRLTYEPKVKTCFGCLRTLALDEYFSNNQRKNNLPHCKLCNFSGYIEAEELIDEPTVEKTIGHGLDAFDRERVRLSECYEP